MNKNIKQNLRKQDCCNEFAKDHFKKELESESTKKRKKYTIENMYHIGQEFFEDQNKKEN